MRNQQHAGGNKTHAKIFRLGALIFKVFYFILIAATCFAGEHYEECTAENSYLESKLDLSESFDHSKPICGAVLNKPPQKFDDLEKIKTELQLPPSCIFQSMARAPVAARYRQCKGGDKPVNASVRPCLSQAYHYSTYLAFIQVMDCLGLAPGELFPIFNGESNFHMNIESGRGALGIGQLTDSPVNGLNQLHSFEPLKKRSSCQSISKQINSQLNVQNHCEWVDPPDGMIKNILYSAQSYQYAKSVARSLMSDSFVKSFKPRDRERAVRVLAQYMYNGGDTAVGAAFRTFKSQESPETVDEFKRRFSSFLALNYDAPYLHPYCKGKTEENCARETAKKEKELANKRIEISSYVTHIDTGLRGVESRLGGLKCSDL